MKETIYVSDTEIPSHLLVENAVIDSLIKEVSNEANIPITSIKSINVTMAAEEKLAEELKSRMPECVALLCQCEEEQRNVSTSNCYTYLAHYHSFPSLLNMAVFWLISYVKAFLCDSI